MTGACIADTPDFDGLEGMSGNTPTEPVEIWRVGDGRIGESRERDLVIAEEPLSIEVEHGQASLRRREVLAVTMRTPGSDMELALGLLYCEGIIHSVDQVVSVREIRGECGGGQVVIGVRLSLDPSVEWDSSAFQRRTFVNSSCGLCGKVDVDAMMRARHQRPEVQAGSEGFIIPVSALTRLSAMVRENQVLFRHTGAVHASAVFDREGGIELVREDVGRHNAMDKVCGAMLAAGKLPAADRGVFFSGRTSFELVQKAAAAGFSMIISVGAPSAVAIEMAGKTGITLAGFIKGTSFNIYTHPERITGDR